MHASRHPLNQEGDEFLRKPGSHEGEDAELEDVMTPAQIDLILVVAFCSFPSARLASTT
jgi:hypothetical protein